MEIVFNSMPWKTLTVQLNKEQMEDATQTGVDRHFNKDSDIRNNSLFNEPAGNESVNHEKGSAVESAFELITGMKKNREIWSRRGDDFDFNDIEVKGRDWPGNDIIFLIKKHEFITKVPLIYVFARVHMDVVQFFGSISRAKAEKLIKKDPLARSVNFGYGPNWGFNPDDLALIIPFYDKNGELKYIERDRFK